MAAPSILLIHADEGFTEKADIALTDLGYYVRVANDARRGLAMALGYPPNLILLDVTLPDKDGLTLLADMRASDELAKVPVIMMSPNARPEIVNRAIQLHINAFLVEPFDLRTLIERSTRLLPRPDPDAEPHDA